MIVASLLFCLHGRLRQAGFAHFSTGELVFYRGFVGLLLMALLARWQGIAYRARPLATAASRGLWHRVADVAISSPSARCRWPPRSPSTTPRRCLSHCCSRLWFRQPVGRSLFGAVALGFVGVVVLLQPTLQPEQWLGAVAGLGSGIVASLAYINVRELGPPRRTRKRAPCSGSPRHQPARAAVGAVVRHTARPELRRRGDPPRVGGFGGCA